MLLWQGKWEKPEEIRITIDHHFQIQPHKKVKSKKQKSSQKMWKLEDQTFYWEWRTILLWDYVDGKQSFAFQNKVQTIKKINLNYSKFTFMKSITYSISVPNFLKL